MLKFSLFLSAALLLASCASDAASAEEYFSIGMAYLDMGKYAEAEQWLNKAKTANRTMTASEYNLGRIAFETRRYSEAIAHFDKVLAQDPTNIMALRSAAYTHIKAGAFDKADAYYNKVLALVPESADDGYNHSLVLFAMKRYDEVETVLEKYPASLADNGDTILLYARAQKAAGKPEAADTYARYLETNKSAAARYEYAEVLEMNSLYVKAIEEYRKAHTDLAADSKKPSKPEVRYRLARVLLIADPTNEEGIAELNGALVDGFADIDTMKTLLDEAGITEEHKAAIQLLIADPSSAKGTTAATAETDAKAEDTETDATDATDEEETP